MSLISSVIVPLAASNASGDFFYAAQYDVSGTFSGAGVDLRVNTVERDSEFGLYFGGDSNAYVSGSTTNKYVMYKVDTSTGEGQWVIGGSGDYNESSGITWIVYDSYNDNLLTIGQGAGGNSGTFPVSGTLFRRFNTDGTFKDLGIEGLPYPGTSTRVCNNQRGDFSINQSNGDVYGLEGGNEIKQWNYNNSTGAYTSVLKSTEQHTYGTHYFLAYGGGYVITMLEQSVSGGKSIFGTRLTNTSQPTYSSLYQWSGTGNNGNGWTTPLGTTSQHAGLVNSSGSLALGRQNGSQDTVGFATVDSQGRGRYQFAIRDNEWNQTVSFYGVSWGADDTKIIWTYRAVKNETGYPRAVHIVFQSETSTTPDVRTTVQITGSPTSDVPALYPVKLSDTSLGIWFRDESGNSASGRNTIILIKIPIDGSYTGSFSIGGYNLTFTDTTANVNWNLQLTGTITEFNRSVSTSVSGQGTVNSYTSNPELNFSRTPIETIVDLS